MRALIIFNLSKTGAATLSAEIAKILKSAGITPCVFGENIIYAEKVGAEIVESPSICNFIITVGGDGTILRWGKVAADYDIPLLGVNLGRLGFMASVEREEIGKIPELLSGEHHISRRMMLNVELIRDGKSVFSQRALNDVTVSRSSRSKLPEFVVSCGESEVSRVRADGIILSTPTGSTAYSLSAGGPILSPDLECVEFTALCPHTLFNRPMIFSDKQTISARVFQYDNSKATFSVDGGKAIPIEENDVLKLTRCPKDLLLIEAGEGFFGAIHNKLLTPLK
ncbi:MAG: NAD(+)/NADH kinase [Oscillospiraceae bacterium]|nr:NAD(+)/NADH kinase [Oscillospiraceae bacterium]